MISSSTCSNLLLISYSRRSKIFTSVIVVLSSGFFILLFLLYIFSLKTFSFLLYIVLFIFIVFKKCFLYLFDTHKTSFKICLASLIFGLPQGLFLFIYFVLFDKIWFPGFFVWFEIFCLYLKFQYHNVVILAGFHPSLGLLICDYWRLSNLVSLVTFQSLFLKKYYALFVIIEVSLPLAYLQLIFWQSCLWMLSYKQQH